MSMNREMEVVQKQVASGLCWHCNDASIELCLDCARCPRCQHSPECDTKAEHAPVD